MQRRQHVGHPSDARRVPSRAAGERGQSLVGDQGGTPRPEVRVGAGGGRQPGAQAGESPRCPSAWSADAWPLPVPLKCSGAVARVARYSASGCEVSGPALTGPSCGPTHLLRQARLRLLQHPNHCSSAHLDAELSFDLIKRSADTPGPHAHARALSACPAGEPQAPGGHGVCVIRVRVQQWRLPERFEALACSRMTRRRCPGAPRQEPEPRLPACHGCPVCVKSTRGIHTPGHLSAYTRLSRPRTGPTSRKAR